MSPLGLHRLHRFHRQHHDFQAETAESHASVGRVSNSCGCGCFLCTRKKIASLLYVFIAELRCFAAVYTVFWINGGFNLKFWSSIDEETLRPFGLGPARFQSKPSSILRQQHCRLGIPFRHVRQFFLLNYSSKVDQNIEV